MYERIAFMSYPRLTALATSVLGAEQIARMRVYDGLFDEALAVANRLVEQRAADVVVSGGGNAQYLKEHLVHVPIITVDPSGFDLMAVMAEAVAACERPVLVTYRGSMPDLNQYLALLGRQVRHLEYRDRNDLQQLVTSLAEDGHDGIIGAGLACELAEEHGLKAFFMYSREAIQGAVSRALDLVAAIRAEKKESQQLRAILDFAYSGIVAVDERGLVQILNPHAEKIIGIRAQDALGQPVRVVIPNTRLDRVLRSGQPELNSFQQFGDVVILTNRVPILVDGRPAGAVATFQAVEEIQEGEQRIRLRLHQKGLVAKNTLADIVGESPAILSARRLAQLYAQEESTVLITGETGTGKELFAQSIHNGSRRRHAPFVAVNCASIPENLLESELFGYEEGAFTGAKKGGKAGLLELAHKGTLFLDEIGHMPLSLQSRLLRVLQEREIMRLGSDRVVPVDIRFVAATNTPLFRELERGRFREDLYYRLNVLHLQLPSLRERRGDIPALVRAMLDAGGRRRLYEERRHDWDRVFDRLAAYTWPGNVRELGNLVQRLCLVMDNDLDLDEVVNDFCQEQRQPAGEAPERGLLMAALQEVQWNRTRAAQRLGVSRTTLWRWMREAGLGRSV